MPDPVRLALIGCGRIAQVAHLPAVEKAEGVELVAVSDPSDEVARSVARRYGVAAASTDQAPLWADASVEAVLIAAPDRFHHGLAAAALAAGRHVLVEKPLAATVGEAEDLVGLVDRTGLTLQVGAMKRHDEGIQYARRFVAERLGEVRSFNAWYRIATCVRASRRPCSRRWSPSGRPAGRRNRSRPTAGGTCSRPMAPTSSTPSGSSSARWPRWSPGTAGTTATTYGRRW